ncbi:MAG TPA: helix-turn-helix domain-containing protein [Frankiaceae bacterium]|nr:helix-turn-helix domain-containing protein [Frankiaceae bacterium]
MTSAQRGRQDRDRRARAGSEDVVADALKKGSRVTGAERDRLAADLRKKYDAGQSIRTLAAASGRSYGFVHRMLSESGATLRGRGGATRTKKSK